MSLRPKCEDYTVGIVCALLFEFAVIGAVFDDHYEDPDRDTIDTNTYDLGRIGEHNVVAACSPSESHGTTSSARVVMDLVRSFRNVRFILFVGLGGGIPGKHDIRLGDVVVGSGTGRDFGGIVQFDSELGDLRKTGFMSLPPNIIRQAIMKDKAVYERTGRSLSILVEDVLNSWPHLRESYSFPGHARDVLFASNYEHVSGSEPGCSHCDRSESIVHLDRHTTEPKVHYGLIASGNMPIRNAVLRDQLAEDLGNPLCFDVSAAGIMKELPAVVIRGICDYSDSHSSREWQHYAALTAAIYAKHLLSYLSSGKIQERQGIVISPGLRQAVTRFPISGFLESHSVASSTAIGDLDPAVEGAALSTIIHSFATEDRFKALCTTALLRMDGSTLQSRLFECFTLLARSIRKTETDPFRRAIAWLLKRHVTYISFTFRERLYSEGSHGAHFNIETLDSAQQEMLTRFLHDRYPQASIETQPNSQIDEDVVIEDDARDDQELINNNNEEEGEPPTSENLAAADQIQQTLCNSWQYHSAMQQLEQAMLPAAVEVISKILHRHCDPKDQQQTVVCSIEWHILEYLDYENITFGELEPTFCITGSLERCCASRLIDYVRSTWGSSELFQFLAQKFQGFSRSSTISDLSRPQVETDDHTSGMNIVNNCSLQFYNTDGQDQFTRFALVKITGSLLSIARLLEQFAWLTATLRCGIEGELTVSEIQFQTDHLSHTSTTQDRLSTGLIPSFRMTLRNPVTSLRTDHKKRGQCWSRFFSASILAHGFPVVDAERPSTALGLEIPFEIMAAFAGDVYPVMISGRIAFANNSIVLIPWTFVGESIQWHVEELESVIQKVEANKDSFTATDPMLETLDISKITKACAIFGYCKNSECLLGTREFLDLEVVESDVPPGGRKLKVKLETEFSSSINAHGYGSVGTKTVWKFGRCERALVEASQLPIGERIDRALATTILLYNQKTETAFLVSELSLVLQMVITSIRQSTDLHESQYPLAMIQADGGQAAYDALILNQNIEIRHRIGDPEKLITIVDRYIKLLEQRRIQSCLERSEYAEVFGAKGLTGWDYAEIQARSLELQARRLRPAKMPVWWELFKERRLLVIFTRMDTAPIRASQDNQGSTQCSTWSDYYPHHQILVAPVVQLERLRKELCKTASKFPTRHMLTSELAWARSKNSYPFEHNRRNGGTCNPVQSMIRVGFSNSLSRFSARLQESQPVERFEEHPGEIPPHGIALFADNPIGFGVRACQLMVHSVEQPVITDDELQEKRWPVRDLFACFVLAFAIAAALSRV